MPTEQPTKWVQVSTELLAELGEWSEPVRVKVVSDTDGVLDMVFKREEELRAALSRYADHDRACDARENALYACTCGFIEMIERVFAREVIAEDNSPR